MSGRASACATCGRMGLLIVCGRPFSGKSRGTCRMLSIFDPKSLRTPSASPVISSLLRREGQRLLSAGDAGLLLRLFLRLDDKAGLEDSQHPVQGPQRQVRPAGEDAAQLSGVQPVAWQNSCRDPNPLSIRSEEVAVFGWRDASLLNAEAGFQVLKDAVHRGPQVQTGGGRTRGDGVRGAYAVWVCGTIPSLRPPAGPAGVRNILASQCSCSLTCTPLPPR